MSATESQREAIGATGNLLVAAGAGAGKTSTLVQRCVRLVLDGVTLQRVLMVTFTEAAAAEMRERIRKALEGRRDQFHGAASSAEHVEEQLALLDTAPISTLHSFCFKLVRRHFHELELDPQLSVLDEAQSAVLREETLDEMFQRHYTNETPLSAAVLQLIQTQGNGREESVREIIRSVHEYTQTQPNPSKWIEAQLAVACERQPIAWRTWRLEALRDWRSGWLELLLAQPSGSLARQTGEALQQLGDIAETEQFAAVLESLPKAVDLEKKFREPEGFFEEADFLRSVTVPLKGIDPLAEDWEWCRSGIETLLLLAREFAVSFAAKKREQGAVDFHDLEQFALRLLWDERTDAATALGEHYRAEFDYVFVDECQDINAAQDAIIRAVSGEPERGSATGTTRDVPDALRFADPRSDARVGNRFLVGDVKQSIYRFRLADPRIFQEYESAWRHGKDGQVISLCDNFRSREALLDFFNALFADLIRPEMGRVRFDEAAKLEFGARERRAALSKAQSPGPRVHVHLRLTSKAAKNGNGANDIAELTCAEHEARIVANRLRELRDCGHTVWKDGSEQPVSWGDMAILLRAPSGKADVYAQEFARQGIPLEVAQSDFFESLEVMDLLSLLMLLDNPLQDVPLLTVLHSPIGGLTPDELAEVRLSNRQGYFWTALHRFHETARASVAWPKVHRFLDRFGRWRRMARDVSLAQRLEVVLSETHYLEWLDAHAPNAERARQCLANVRHLLALAQQFDPFQRQGVQRFLRFVEAQRSVTGKEPIVSSGTAVQLISIHRSKGLEYPVVVVPDLGKRFNLDDLSADIVLHERFGLCPRIKPPHTGRRYPSLTHWLHTKHERTELLGEEMRLLYVAMTRARDTLLLVGTAARKRVEQDWPGCSSTPAELLAANSMLDWLGPWLMRNGTTCSEITSGQNELFSWRFYEQDETELPALTATQSPRIPKWLETDSQASERFSWKYPFVAATHESAKSSVSTLRRQCFAPDEEARPRWPQRGAFGASTRLAAADVGVANHTFLEYADPERLKTCAGLDAEVQRLVASGVLSLAEAGALKREGIVKFWSSDIGAQFLGQWARVRRELPFTARFNTAELRKLGATGGADVPGEFIVVQGVADIVALLRSEIWLLDFKTDLVDARDIEEKGRVYRDQLSLYAAALERIYRRPVTQCWLHFLVPGETLSVPVR